VDTQFLPFGEPKPGKESGVFAFLAEEKFTALPTRYQKAIEQATNLYQFLEKKEDVSFAPVFTPFLGPMDEAAKGLLLRMLQDNVPADRGIQYDYFHPDLSDLPTGEMNFHMRQAKNLERTLVDQNGLMPIGLLRWCLDYTRTTRRNIEGVFKSVRNRFADIVQTELFSVIDSIYKFRNEYVAHQDRELSDTELAKEGVKEWSNGLYNIWKCS